MGILAKIRNTGWKYTFAIVFNRVVPLWLFRLRRFVVYRMDDQVATPSNPTVTISQCSSEAQIREVEELTYFRRDYSTGQSHAFSARRNDQLAGGVWAATEAFDENELGIRLSLRDHQTWIFAALVSKQHRRQGIYLQLLPFVIREMAAVGKQQALVAVNPDNHASHRIHQSRSKETVGHVLAIRFLTMTGCWTWGNISKQRTFSWNSKEKPVGVEF